MTHMTTSKNSFKAGDILIVRFPFSNLQSQKVRPALVVVDQKDEDILLVPISSAEQSSSRHYRIADTHYLHRKLPIISSVKYTKLFSLHQSLIHGKYTELKLHAFVAVRERIVHYVSGR